MRNNGPVTQKEITIPESYILSTTTDLKGTMLNASDDFIKISGYSKQEMIGQPHNILRHPDVPAQVFEDMWATLKAGKNWSAIVKNRAKNGDHYWVLANASPIFENKQPVGYISVRTPASEQQKTEAAQLYKAIAEGKMFLQNGFARKTSDKKWDIFSLRGSLSKVLVLYASVVLVFGLALLASGFYKMLISPIKQQELTIATTESEALIKSLLSQKGSSVIDMAATMASDPTIEQVMAGELPREAAVERLKIMRDHYAKITDYKNIRIQLYDLNKASYVRSWKPDTYGDNHLDRIRDQVYQSQKVVGGLSVNKNDFGIGVTGYAPIFHNQKMVGVVSMSGGVGSLVRELKQQNIDWVFVVREDFFKGKLPKTLEKNPSFSEGYVLAHDKWFDSQAIDYFKQHIPANNAEVRAYSYIVGDRIVLDIPAYNKLGELLGRHFISLSADKIISKIDKATSQVVFALVGLLVVVSLIVIMILSLIRKRVVKPINQLLKSMEVMTESGRFNDRIVQLDAGDEISRIINVYNGFCGNVQRAITNVNDVMSSVAQGKFDVSIDDQLNGDLLVMKNSVNASVASVRDTMSALEIVMDALYEGNFNVTMPDNVKGDFRNKVDQAVYALKMALNDVNRVMQKMSEGKFQHRVEAEARGELLELKQTVNSSMNALEGAITEITSVNKALSEGDLTQFISGDYHGELRLLKEAVNASVARLDGIVSVAKEAALVVDHASKEVSQGSHDLSDRVQQQAAALEQTSATMDQMNSSIQHNTANANQASSVAQTVQTKANEGLGVMQKTIDAMSEIQQSSHKIAEIVTLIDGIAFQTNLLALNAAVEAARAGDHGRGFAVVAGEVRSLAQKSADAAKDIKALIDESVARIDHGTQMASSSGEMLQGIADSVNDVTDMIQQIAKASNEQAAGITQVHDAISSIDRATQQNAALVEETTAAAESMSDQAKNLSNEMAFFTISNQSHFAELEAQARQQPTRALPKPSASQVKSAANKPSTPAKKTESAADDWSEF